MRNHAHELGSRPHRYSAGFVFGRIWLGALFLALGVLWLLDNMRVLDSDAVLEWWPVVLIAFGATKLIDPVRRRPFSAFLLIGAGAWLLAHNLGLVHWDVWELWPLLLIALGARIVWRGMRGPGSPPGHPLHPGGIGPHALSAPAAGVAGAASAAGSPGASASAPVDTDTFGGFAMWSGVDRKVTSQAFRGGDFTAFMGGAAVDLRAAKPVPTGAVIDFTVVMGGVEVVVPDDWQVVNDIQCVMGGVEDSRTATPPAGDRLLYLRGFVLMGGIEIRNRPDK